jgi:hypothetical protein
VNVAMMGKCTQNFHGKSQTDASLEEKAEFFAVKWYLRVTRKRIGHQNKSWSVVSYF